MDNKTIGIFGKLHPNFLKDRKLPENVIYAELILDDLELEDDNDYYNSNNNGVLCKFSGTPFFY